QVSWRRNGAGSFGITTFGQRIERVGRKFRRGLYTSTRVHVNRKRLRGKKSIVNHLCRTYTSAHCEEMVEFSSDGRLGPGSVTRLAIRCPDLFSSQHERQPYMRGFVRKEKNLTKALGAFFVAVVFACVAVAADPPVNVAGSWQVTVSG